MKPLGHLRNLPREIWWIAAASLVNRMGAMVFPFLILYFHRSLGFDLKLASSIAACWGLGSFLSGPLGGWAADRFDCVRLLAASLVTTGALMLVYPLVQQPGVLFVATFGLALVADLARPSNMTALARLGGNQHGRDAFALNYLAVNLGMSIGPVLGGFLAEHDYRWLFWVDGSTSLLAGSLLFLSGVRCPPAAQQKSTPPWHPDRATLQFFLWLALTYWIFMTFFSAAPLQAVEGLKLRERDCGWIWLLNTVLIVTCTMTVTRLTQAVPLQRLLAGASLGLTFCYLCLALVPGYAGLILATLCLTLGEMLLFANSNEFLSRLVPPERIGRAMGCNAMIVSLALTTASPTAGYFFAQQQPNQLWILMAIVAAIVCLGFLSLREPPPRSAAGP